MDQIEDRGTRRAEGQGELTRKENAIANKGIG